MAWFTAFAITFLPLSCATLWSETGLVSRIRSFYIVLNGSLAWLVLRADLLKHESNWFLGAICPTSFQTQRH